MEFNKLIPELSVKNLDKSLEFYLMLGFKKEYERKDFAFLSFQGSQLMIQTINNKWNTGELKNPFGRGINFQIEVNNIKSLIQILENNNYPLFRELEENWYQKDNKLLGNKEFLIQDPDGYLLRFAQDLGSKLV